MRPRASRRVLSTIALGMTMFVLSQCSSAGDSNSAVAPSSVAAIGPQPVPTTILVVTYGDEPTAPAKMVCGDEGQSELNAVFKVDGLHVTTPTWTDHLYECTYQYPNGSFTVSVKELPTIAGTVDYFATLEAQHGESQPLELGQDGFMSIDGTSVVRKDNKVLVVDVAKLPETFGATSMNRTGASTTIAVTLLGCWVELAG